MPVGLRSGMDGDSDLSVDLVQRLAMVEEELATLRQLVTRAYEDTQRAAETVLRARREPAYRNAYLPDPLVTVRIGAYRGGDPLFERALRSVLEQTYPRFEVIVVCDGPDEETARRVTRLGDERVRCVQRPRNGPYPSADTARWQVAGCHPFNLAVALAQGSWIAPIDQDDEWAKDHLQALLEVAQETRAEVIYGVGRVVLGDGSETYFGTWPPALGDFGFQTAIYHAGLAAFLYDANSHLINEPADWNLGRRMLEAGVSFEFVGRIVTSYFVHEDASGFGWWKQREQERGTFGSGRES
jgi:glycosyltransferase involved in cell wall biosynthesis